VKLFALPDGVVDRKDRAQWLSCPFDLAFSTAVETPKPLTGITWATLTLSLTWNVNVVTLTHSGMGE
jgi:hypothetical protein